MRELVRLLETAMKQGQDTVLVTIVASSGSTPRGEGARMLVTEHGRVGGTIGGGAVEHHSEVVALEVLKTKNSHTEHYQLKQNEIQDLGMICGGDVTVYFQYIAAAEEIVNLTKAIEKLYEAGEEFWMVNDISEDGNGKMAVCKKNGVIEGMQLPEVILEGLQKKPIQIDVENRRYYCEQLMLPGKVYIFGGGHVSQALVPALAAVDFRCVVLEDREEFANPELFPQAEKTILIKNDRITEYVNIGAMDYVCIMTRGHKDDLLVQSQVLGTKASYIGVIGSRHKKAGVFAKLKEQGFTEQDLERITTPIGLDIGGETPAEIAVSITAQLIQKRAGR